MTIRREMVLVLYRSLMKESKKWNSYNYRMYALRKIRHDFQKNKLLSNGEDIQKCYDKGLEALNIIKRQVVVGNLYHIKPLVIEN